MKNQKLELTWIGKDKQFKIEPRILIEDKEKSYGDKNTGNMLIHGDNLLALKALEDKFTNKIKCVYIDPPYNTGSAFEYYNDNLEHSTWLNLMMPRLKILKKLLGRNGAICIQCDDSEQAYLKVLCDEIFGRENFQNMITVETGEVFGTKASHINKTFVKVKDYILIYVVNKDENFHIKPLWTKTNEMFDTHYSYYIKDNKKYNLIEILKQQKDIVKIFEKYNIKLKLSNLSKVMELDEDFKKYINEELAEYIYQDQPYSQKIPQSIENELNKSEIVNYNNLLLFKTASGSIRYYKSFKDSIHMTDDYSREMVRATARGDLWKNYHIDMRNINDEGDVKFKASKKPERLIRDILYSYTNENDYVLDSFLGSGTTCAVAHKMKRRWIGIELGDHCYTLCEKRIKNIIDGKDKTGITKREGWIKGGGYKFYELAPSLLVKDKFNNWVISENFNGDLLIRAICKQEKFDYSPDNNYYWKQGKSSENDYIYVTTNYISLEYLQNIKEEMKDDESLLICCKAYQEECKDKYDNITIKKIPQSILNNCEYGRDDYSLNIEEVLEGQEHE